MIGKCLCEAVQFKILTGVPNFYRCHCSLCRKQSGTASNTATFVPVSDFVWLQGEDKVTRFNKDTGFTSHFCSTCGCPVPNPLRNTDKYWVPAGLLENEGNQKVALDIYTHSKACWDSIAKSTTQYDEMPDFDTIHNILQETNM